MVIEKRLVSIELVKWISDTMPSSNELSKDCPKCGVEMFMEQKILGLEDILKYNIIWRCPECQHSEKELVKDLI